MEVSRDTKVVQETTSVQNTANGVVDSRVEEVKTEVPTDRFVLSKVDQVIWFGIALIELVIVARFLLLLFGANMSGFVRTIYSLSSVFVSPFVGMFNSPRFNESFFDSASLVALVVWLAVGFILSAILKLLDRSEV